MALFVLCSCANETKSVEKSTLEDGPMEAGIIMASFGPLKKVQIDPGGRWFVFSGGNDVKIFPVKIGTAVKADKYVFFEAYNYLSGTTEYTGKSKQSPVLQIDRPGLYFYSTVVVRRGGYTIINEPDWQVLSMAKQKYPQYFSTMVHNNFKMDELKRQYDANLKRTEEEDKKSREVLDKGLPIPQTLPEPK